MPLSVVKSLKLSNANKLITDHINMNPIRHKFDELKYIIRENIDIFVISEIKLDIIFPSTQFCINGYSKPFRLDRDKSGGGIIILIRNDIPCKLLKTDNNCNLEGLFVEINLRKRKWLLFGGYNPHKSQSDIFFKTIGNHLDRFISIYDDID